MIPGKQYSFDTLLQVARRRKWLIILPAIIVGAIGAAIVWSLPNTYRSETLILVVPQRVPESYVRSTVTARIEDRLQSISQQILSRTRLEKIIRDLDPYPEARGVKPMESIVEDMIEDIEVTVVEGSEALRVTYVSTHPRMAMKVTERLAGLFIEENLRDRENLADATNAFLDTQLEDARRRLVEQEKQLELYRGLQYSSVFLDATLLGATDATYQGDAAYSASQVSQPCSPVGAACTPSQTVTGPDGRSYRLDTFMTWTTPAGGTPVKQVTVVVRKPGAARTLARVTSVVGADF